MEEEDCNLSLVAVVVVLVAAADTVLVLVPVVAEPVAQALVPESVPVVAFVALVPRNRVLFVARSAPLPAERVAPDTVVLVPPVVAAVVVVVPLVAVWEQD